MVSLLVCSTRFGFCTGVHRRFAFLPCDTVSARYRGIQNLTLLWLLLLLPFKDLYWNYLSVCIHIWLLGCCYWGLNWNLSDTDMFIDKLRPYLCCLCGKGDVYSHTKITTLYSRVILFRNILFTRLNGVLFFYQCTCYVATTQLSKASNKNQVIIANISTVLGIYLILIPTWMHIYVTFIMFPVEYFFDVLVLWCTILHIMFISHNITCLLYSVSTFW